VASAGRRAAKKIVFNFALSIWSEDGPP